MKKFSLSIIIVSYNTKDLTLNCLASLDKYPLSSAFEVVVVDNNSTDGSVVAIRKFKPKNYKLVLLENTENSGFSKANNQGIKVSAGENILLLNSDTEMQKGVLDRLLNFSNLTADAGVVAPRLLNSDRSIQSSVYRFPTLARAFSQYVLGKKVILDKYAPNSKFPTEVEVAVGACFLISSRALKKVGGLDERYFMYYEDFEYCRKLKEAGLKVYYLPEAKVVHIHGASGKGSPEQVKRLVAASKVYHGVVAHTLIQLMIKIGDKIR